MSIVVEATYENGLLKLDKPLPLGEHTRVQVTVSPVGRSEDPLEAVIGIGEGPPDGAENHDKYIYRKPAK